MPKALKVILAVVGFFTFACVLAAVVGAGWVKKAGRRFLQDSAVMIRDGRTYGTGRDTGLCLTEGLRRMQPCTQSAIGCQIDAQVFTDGCLSTAREVPGLCINVPPVDEIRASVAWRINQCMSVGHGADPKCPNFMQTLQQHCVRRLFQQNMVPNGPTVPSGDGGAAAPIAPTADTVKPSAAAQP